METKSVKPYIIGVDPSGSYNEGKGTTGICVLNPEGHIAEHLPVCAQDYTSQMSYWKAVVDNIELLLIRYPGAVISIEDYVLYASAAKAQINSEMETSKLIGALTMFAYDHGTHLFIRNASQVMNRWTNDILAHKGIIVKQGVRWCDPTGLSINKHCLDSIRHAVHCHYFEIEKAKYMF